MYSFMQVIEGAATSIQRYTLGHQRKRLYPWKLVTKGAAFESHLKNSKEIVSCGLGGALH